LSRRCALPFSRSRAREIPRGSRDLRLIADPISITDTRTGYSFAPRYLPLSDPLPRLKIFRSWHFNKPPPLGLFTRVIECDTSRQVFNASMVHVPLVREIYAPFFSPVIACSLASTQRSDPKLDSVIGIPYNFPIKTSVTPVRALSSLARRSSFVNNRRLSRMSVFNENSLVMWRSLFEH